MKLIIQKAGLFTTVQDQGRFGYEAYAVPVSGVMDKKAARRANLLLGNDENQAVIEMTLIGPEIMFTAKAQFCITGGNLSPKLNNTPIQNEKVIHASAHDVLSFGAAIEGCRAYLAIAGELLVPQVMASKSTYTYGGFGGYKGRILENGDEIRLHTVIREERKYFEYLSHEEHQSSIRLIKGPEFELFSKEDQIKLVSKLYRLSSSSNRMGLRLEGECLPSVQQTSIISSPLIPGTIQVPPSGMPIIAMYDSGTMGGYPRIAVVCEEDMNLLAQGKPHDTFRFSWY